MTAGNQEIITSYETLGMSPEDIAAELDLEVTAVKAVLFQNSSIYRKDAKTDETLQFTETEAEECKRIIMNIARYSEDENLQFRSARYVLDSKTGRLDAQKALPSVQFNVLNFNEHMKKAIAAARNIEQKAIEVSTSREDVKEVAA